MPNLLTLPLAMVQHMNFTKLHTSMSHCSTNLDAFGKAFSHCTTLPWGFTQSKSKVPTEIQPQHSRTVKNRNKRSLTQLQHFLRHARDLVVCNHHAFGHTMQSMWQIQKQPMPQQTFQQFQEVQANRPYLPHKTPRCHAMRNRCLHTYQPVPLTASPQSSSLHPTCVEALQPIRAVCCNKPAEIFRHSLKEGRWNEIN